MSQSVGWTSSIAVGEGPEEGLETAVLRVCGSLLRKGVLVVPRGRSGGWSVLRRAKAAGAMVTALCPRERARDAKLAGADVVMDPERQDPTWYRGAWTLIYDPAGRIGFARASSALARPGVYVTCSASLAERARALLARLGGGPRLYLTS
jgi:NADPH:quinone reductase-like Zn-dependent oxidoreductase